MFTSGSMRRYVVLAVGTLLLGGVITSGVIAGQFRGPEDPETLAAALREDPAVRVADIGAVQGLPGRGVFVQFTSTGLLCLFDAPSPTALARQGGCNSADDPLGGRRLFASLSYEGGPGVEQVKDARLIGLVSADVEAVEVLMTDGTRREVALRRPVAFATRGDSYRAFGYRFKVSDLKRGLGPTAVLALDSNGGELDRQLTGFGG